MQESKTTILQRLKGAFYCLLGHGVMINIEVGCLASDNGEINREALVINSRTASGLFISNGLASFKEYYVGGNKLTPDDGDTANV